MFYFLEIQFDTDEEMLRLELSGGYLELCSFISCAFLCVWKRLIGCFKKGLWPVEWFSRLFLVWVLLQQQAIRAERWRF